MQVDGMALADRRALCLEHRAIRSIPEERPHTAGAAGAGCAPTRRGGSCQPCVSVRCGIPSVQSWDARTMRVWAHVVPVGCWRGFQSIALARGHGEVRGGEGESSALVFPGSARPLLH